MTIREYLKKSLRELYIRAIYPKYEKPATGIPATDLSEAVQESLEKADNPPAEVFWAEYGVTTAAEIDAAVAAGKQLFCINGGYIHTYAGKDSNYHYFFAIVANIYFRRLSLSISGGAWAFHNLGVERTADKVASLSSASTNTQYPSAKATYDAINPAVQSAQPSGGFAPNVLYNLGELTGNVTFALATPADANIANHYYWTFDTASSAPTITWPTGITWMGGSAPTINADKHYEISVLNGIGTFLEV